MLTLTLLAIYLIVMFIAYSGAEMQEDGFD
jgi:hypothetical protein